jgi:hypothetical protein
LKPSYVAANDSERARLGALLARLSDEDLARRLPNGLTIATVFVHLAFWDEYARWALRGWRDSGFSDSRTNFEAVNSSVLTLAATVPDHAAVELARAAADAADCEAEAVSPELAEVIQANGKLRVLERAQHRRTHLDQIEGVLPGR